MWIHIARAFTTLVLAGTAVGCGATDSADERTADPDRSPTTDSPSLALAALTGDSAAILEDLRFLSSDELRGRATGSEGAALARMRLADRFNGAGLEPLAGGYERSFTWTRRDVPEERTGVNLVGLLRGTEHPGRYIVVSGHYDHLGVRGGEIYNGADDNASGAVAVAALARALRSVALRNSVIFVAFEWLVVVGTANSSVFGRSGNLNHPATCWRHSSMIS